LPEKFLSALRSGGRVFTCYLPLLLLTSALLLSLSQLSSAIFEGFGTLSHLRWARSLNPLDHQPHLLLADLEPERSLWHWARIRTIHPLYAPAWVRLGLEQEMSGNAPEAERTLLHAASLDRTFLPQWTLANFYFRQGRPDRFWTHARRAVAVYQGDLTGVLQLCLRLEPDPVRMWERLAPVYPPARMDLMRLLLAAGRFNDAARVAGLVASVRTHDTRDLLLEACEQAARRDEAAAALAFWNAAARNGRIPLPPLDPAKGVYLADRAFQFQPAGGCFGWRAPSQDGVYVHAGKPAGLRIELTGRQAEGIQLAAVRIPVLPRRRYRLAWRYSAGLRGGSEPPQWRINGSVGKWLTEAHGAEDSLEFEAGPKALAELSLAVARSRGTTRPEGTLRLEWVSISETSAAGAGRKHL